MLGKRQRYEIVTPAYNYQWKRRRIRQRMNPPLTKRGARFSVPRTRGGQMVTDKKYWDDGLDSTSVIANVAS